MIELPRITSYNVCYTKLLRQKSGVLYLALEDTYNRLHHRLTSITEISSDNINLAIESYSLEQGLLSQLREYMFENNNIV